jgi:outer membrane protein TolC
MIASRPHAKPLGHRPAVDAFDVREHLLTTATRLFAERGIAATTVAQNLLDSQRQALQSALDRPRAQANRFAHTAALLQSLGGGWDASAVQ